MRDAGRDRSLSSPGRTSNDVPASTRHGNARIRSVRRIAQLANFYSETSGGLRVAVDKLGEGYRAHGHQVTLIAPAAAGA